MALNFTVELTAKAKQDLRCLHDYIVDQYQNPKDASKLLERLTSAAKSLAVFPKMHRVRKKDSNGREIRFFPVDDYVIIYFVDERKQLVSIMHFCHGRRDFAREILGEL